MAVGMAIDIAMAMVMGMAMGEHFFYVGVLWITGGEEVRVEGEVRPSLANVCACTDFAGNVLFRPTDIPIPPS